MIAVISPPEKITGEITLPGDKSISHRALILSALARGTSRIENLLEAQDCLATIECLRMLGIEVNFKEEAVEVTGRGLKLKPPSNILYAGNSGTTARLLLGLLAGQNFVSKLKGDASLNRRPMKRVVDPLTRMGAEIQGQEKGNKLPLKVRGGTLSAVDYTTEVASAQVKSAVLLAGLFAKGKTKVCEPYTSRDHTERMLKSFGVEVEKDGNCCSVVGPVYPQRTELRVPGDISSAFFLVVAAAIIPGSEITIKEVGVNPTRTGALEVLEKMGANISLFNREWYGNEPVADLYVCGDRDLKGVTVKEEMIPRMVDEIPALCVAALAAQGETVIEGASELRFKESDRISTLVQEFSKLGAKVQEKPDGIILEGGITLTGNHCQSHGDHRLAMSLALAGFLAKGETYIKDFEVVNVSFPGYFQCLRKLLG